MYQPIPFIRYRTYSTRNLMICCCVYLKGIWNLFWVSLVLTISNISLLCNVYIQDGGGQKDPSTSFSPVTSTNVEISPQNFLTFNFNPFVTLVLISMPYLVPVPNYWTWTKTKPQKSVFFWSYPYKIEVMIIMITSLIEILELPKFGHMTTSTIKFDSLDKILLMAS